MKVIVDSKRILHLTVLIISTVTFGNLLMQLMEWDWKVSYGLSCTVICQLNNIVMKLQEVSNAVNVASIEETRNDGRGKRNRSKKKKG